MDLLGEMQGDMQTTYNDVLFSCRHGERIVCELGVFPLDPAERDGFIGDSVAKQIVPYTPHVLGFIHSNEINCSIAHVLIEEVALY